MTTTARTRINEDTTRYGTLTKYNGTVPIASHTHVVQETNDVMYDHVVSNYHELVQAGIIVNNPMRHTRKHIISGGGSYTATRPGIKYYTAGDGSITRFQLGLAPATFGDICPTSSDPDMLINLIKEAKFNCLSKVDSAPYPMGEDYVELRKTLELLRHPAHQFRRTSVKFETAWRTAFRKKRAGVGLSNYARLKRLEGADLTKATRKDLAFATSLASEAMADVWLVGNFGFGNIARSMVTLLSGFNDKLPPKVRMKVTGYSERYEQGHEIVNRVLTSTAYDVYSHSANYEASVRAYLLFEITHPLNQTVTKFGLRLSDLPKIAWQVAPASWVIDQFYNISGAIQGFMAITNPRVKVLAAGYTVKESLVDQKSYIDQVNPPYVITIDPDTLTTETTSRTRNIWSPSVLDTAPTFKPPGLIEGPAGKVLSNVAFGLQKLDISAFLRRNLR